MGEIIGSIVLDSNIVSYIFNRNPIARYYVERLRGARQYISFQTLEEAWYGARITAAGAQAGDRTSQAISNDMRSSGLTLTWWGRAPAYVPNEGPPGVSWAWQTPGSPPPPSC